MVVRPGGAEIDSAKVGADALGEPAAESKHDALVPAHSPERGDRVRIPKQARSRRTRERTLEAAGACFEELGYDETTTAAIARRAGVAVGSVYDYFEDKRAILLELLHSTVEVVADMVVQGLEAERWQGADPKASVRQLIHLVFTARQVQPGLQRILWERFFKDPEFRAAMEAIEARLRGAIQTRLTALRDDGLLRVRDVHTASFVIQVAVEWISSRLVLAGEEIDVDAAVETCSDMFCRFLFPNVD
jgi:AcrR family transcriptional regulator